jgi:hypothetical protein
MNIYNKSSNSYLGDKKTEEGSTAVLLLIFILKIIEGNHENKKA